MENDSLDLPLDIYSKYLRSIGDIEFTQREVDILACLVGGQSTRTIPSFLSIAARTVASHIRGIRLKTGCTSQASIIDFVERSGKAPILKEQYYLSLCNQVSFEKQLKRIPRTGSAQSPRCFIVYEREQKDKCPFIYYLEGHLKLAGFNTEAKIKDGEKSVVDFLEELEPQQGDHILYIVPQALELHQAALGCNEDQCILLFPDKREHSEELDNIKHVNFSGAENYYFSIFELLKKLKTDFNFDKIIEYFKKSCEEVSTLPEKIETLTYFQKQAKTNAGFLRVSLKKRFKIVSLASLILSFICIILFIAHWSLEKSNGPSIRSDMPIPAESAFLNRSGLMAQLDDKFKGSHSIQTVALVGIGGVGKTTLARQYAQSQNLPVVWEINAETKESLTGSFDNLALAFATTEEDQKILKELQDIKDPIKKENSIIQFVKNHLKALPNWFLIYDNVEKFTDIQKYFPQDSHTWGKGKIILTTRDENIQNNKYVNYMILIGDLDPNQKFSLFTKIMGGEKSSFLEKTQQAEMKKFLENIPPFPLDVSIAAYYLKATQIPYKNYIENLETYNNDFESVQKNISKELGEYDKTRYGIITLSLEHLIKIHKDFAALLLFISLLDSQKIPRELLNSYKNNQVVDSFIYYLKKYSLITNNSYEESLQSTLSIHRSTQTITLSYLVKTLKLQENKNNFLIQELVRALEKYVEQLLDKESLSQGKQLISHLERFLSHNHLLIDSNKGLIESELGRIYSSLDLFIQANHFLEAALSKLKKDENQHYEKIAQNLLFQGGANFVLGNFRKGKYALGESIRMYKRRSPNNIPRLALGLMYLGNLYKWIGEYKTAKQFLEQSLSLYEKLPSQNCVGKVMTLAYLGHAYCRVGEYKSALDITEEGLAFCKKYLPQNSVRLAWPLVILWEIHHELGNYGEAINLIDQATIIYEKNFSKNSIFVAHILSSKANSYCNLGHYQYAISLSQKALKILEKVSKSDFHSCRMNTLVALGNAYKGLKDYKKAKYFLEKNLIISEEYFTKNHIDTAQALESLGQVYLLEGNLKIAKEFFDKALNIFQKNNHPSAYKCLEDFSALYLQKTSEYNREKALIYLKQALEVVKAHFPADSLHIKRIKEKLKALEDE